MMMFEEKPGGNMSFGISFKRSTEAESRILCSRLFKILRPVSKITVERNQLR